MLRLRRITLTQFRNYAGLTWAPAARVSVFFGPNGSGKTNLLEAVSLLAPGRGLRGARIADLPRRGADGRWAVAGRFVTPDGPLEIGTGTPPDGPADRRAFRLDGGRPRSQAEIATRVAAVWLTPPMDRLFQEGASGRRRFLDRLVLALEPAHARELAAYEATLAERSRLLARGGADAAWLAGLEDQMARHAVAATAARMALAGRMDAALSQGVIAGFPPAQLALECPIADRLATLPAVDVEDWLRAALAHARRRDAEAGGAAFGAHRTDMALRDAASGLPAALASTGEQKALLLAVVLAHAALMAEARGFAPLLLLDEPAIHLDPDRRAALFAAIATLPAQVLLTGTDAETFLPLSATAEGLRTGEGALTPDGRFSARDALLPPGPEAP
ncbi:MAG: DNA replication/repair protein RecF [Acetobacteraceae bacterium]